MYFSASSSLFPTAWDVERSDLMADCADIRSEWVAGNPRAPAIVEELIDLAAYIIDFGADLTAIALRVDLAAANFKILLPKVY